MAYRPLYNHVLAQSYIPSVHVQTAAVRICCMTSHLWTACCPIVYLTANEECLTQKQVPMKCIRVIYLSIEPKVHLFTMPNRLVLLCNPQKHLLYYL